MATWILVPCLGQLRTEFNRIAPNRDKTTDGSIGDAAHQDSVSDHNPDETGAVPIRDADSVNEVHAIDVDIDLRVPGLTMEGVVQFILKRCRSGAEKRLRYIIYNRRIWSASSDWVQQSYSGANAHSAHAHFSASYDTAREASTASWHLEDLVALTEAEIDRIVNETSQKVLAGVGVKVWNHEEPNPYDEGATKRRMGGDLRYMEYRDDQRALSTNVHRLDNQVIPAVNEIRMGVAQLLSDNGVDEELLANLVLGGLTPERLGAGFEAAGLTPESLAAAIPAHMAGQVVDLIGARIRDEADPAE
jgi:hypothetical protein